MDSEMMRRLRQAREAEGQANPPGPHAGQVLYHFTSTSRWPQIERAGVLEPSDSGLRENPSDPLVVHLTAEHRGCDSIEEVKQAIRIAVEVQDASPWIAWMRDHCVDEAWLAELRRGHTDDDKWHVVERSIGRDEWIDVTEMESYETLWERVVTTVTQTVTRGALDG